MVAGVDLAGIELVVAEGTGMPAAVFAGAIVVAGFPALTFAGAGMVAAGLDDAVVAATGAACGGTTGRT